MALSSNPATVRRPAGREAASIEQLERRRLFTRTFVVNDAGDGPDASIGDGVARTVAGVATLRAVIDEVNAKDEFAEIRFSLPAGTVIRPATVYPDIFFSVNINGRNQTTGRPGIVLDGISATGTDVAGLALRGGNSTVEGLCIQNYQGHGLVVGLGNQYRVVGNYIGTDITGTLDRGNGYSGIRLVSASSSVIGGVSAAERNIISGNALQGILIDTVTSPTSSNQFLNNYIGTDVTGTIAIPNGGNGITMVQSASNLISGNLLSGNAGSGILINGDSSVDNQIKGNLIGTNAAGTAAVPNAVALANAGKGAISLRGGSRTLIGGTAASDRNVISGNGGPGISIEKPTTSHVIKGNFIGTNAAGTAALANQGAGLLIESAPNTVGGTEVGARNVISGNTGHGIDVQRIGESSTVTSGTTVQGNFIGTNAQGTAAVGNGGSGLNLEFSRNDLIGGLPGLPNLGNPQAGNVISGNVGHGIWVHSHSSNDTLIRGNFIGTNADGTAAIGNGGDGVLVEGERTMIGAGNPNGTTGANLISGNGGNGIEIAASAINALVQGGNRIGTKLDGTSALGNGRHGVLVAAGTAAGHTIGGADAGQGNVIAFNGLPASPGAGVAVTAGTGTRILRNSIFSNTGLGIDLGANPGGGGGAGVSPGVTVNDDKDSDAGPNALQNCPVIVNVGNDNNQPRVRGTLNSVPLKTYRLDFYNVAAADPSGAGEGDTWLATTNVTTDANGNAPFELTLTVPLPANRLITATATDPDGNTSEFAPFPVVSPIPSAALQATDATIANATSHTFDVIYSDTGALSLGSMDNQDVVVRFPDGTTTSATTLVTTNPSPGNSPVRATYRFAAPGGTFDPADNGVYSVLVQPAQVADVEGNFVPAGQIGTFKVTIPTGQLEVISSFNVPAPIDLNSAAYDPALGRVYVRTFTDSIRVYDRSGALVGTIALSGASQLTTDLDVAPEPVNVGGTTVPAGTLLATADGGGDSGATLFAINPAGGAVLASRNLNVFGGGVVGASYHPQRNTLFCVRAADKMISEVDPATGSVLNTFAARPAGTAAFDVANGDVEVWPGSGNLLLVSTAQAVIRELTPTGGFVRDVNVAPLGVGGMSGIGLDDQTGEAWISKGLPTGTVFRVGGLFSSVVPTGPVLSAVALNDGTAQRSQVKSLTLTFDRAVTLAAGAVTLQQLNSGGSGTNDNSSPTDVSSALNPPPTVDNKTFVFTFAGASTFVQNASLADGIYRVSVDPAKVTANGVAMSAAPQPLTFHRLFGDRSGDGTVNPADYIQFRNAFGKNQGVDAGYDSAFDFNNDGTINSTDYIQFRNRFGKTFTLP